VDAEAMSRNETRRCGEEVPSHAIRPDLPNVERSDKPFEPLTFNMGTPQVDLKKAAALAARLEDGAVIGRHRRSR
jgi:hypothetical protein